jgi:hypothetical protein
VFAETAIIIKDEFGEMISSTRQKVKPPLWPKPVVTIFVTVA